MPRNNGGYYPGAGGVSNPGYETDWNYSNQGTYRADSKPDDIGAQSQSGTRFPSPPVGYQHGPTKRATKKSFWSGIKLLMWKNFLLRKRHYVVTGFEIILPTLLTFMIVFLKTLTPPIPPVQNDVSYQSNEFTEQILLKQLKWSGRRRNATFVLGYAPQNEFTDLIMRTFEEAIKNNGKYSLPSKHVIRPFASEAELKKHNSRQGLNKQPSNTTEREILRAAIIFEEGFSSNEFNSENRLKQNYGYKIRMVDKNYNTEEVYEDPDKRQPGPNTRNAAKGYQDGGFATLQVFLDKAITKVISNHTIDYQVVVQGFPYPPYRTDLGFNKIFVRLLPFFMVFGFIFIVPSILRNTVAEKEDGIKELMKIMSLESYMHWLGWLIDSILILLIPITVVVALLFIEFNPRSGAFLVYSDPTLWWVVIYLYILSAVSFLFFMSTFFQRATMAISVGTVAWILSYVILSSILGKQYYWLNLSQKMASCLLPNMALHWAVTLMFSLESSGIGARWSYLNKPLTSLDDFTVGHVMLMLIINIFFYMVLTLYFECILPSSYGISKPWNFIFKKSYWESWMPSYKANDYAMDNMKSNFRLESSGGFEAEPTQARCSVQVQSLRKEFSGSFSRQTKVAVSGLDLNMYHGQISVLLGCNGAGKTTTISILTGATGPTQGTAVINGFDIRKDMDTIRTQLGYCPQHNILFDKLTVEENLQFFGMLKGMSTSEVDAEVDYLLGKLDLKDKKGFIAGNLSGGQKRKTCLGSALVGGSEFVIMDEPTAGMDPEARRGIWDLLLELRFTRTMLLTTHFMEEADILGDRIAIMAKGKIHCCGSPLFLKRHYGSGYTLIMSIRAPPDSNPAEIFNVVQKHCPVAYWKEQVPENNENPICDVSIVLPRQDGVNVTSNFPNLFKDLTQREEELGIIDIGLPLTSLDDVFAKVDEETRSSTPTDSGFGLQKLTDFQYNESGKEMMPVPQLEGFQLQVQHFIGLFLKRFIYTRRRYALFGVQLMLPFVLIMCGVLMFNSLNRPVPPGPALKIDLTPYRFPKVVYHTDNETEQQGFYYRSTVQDLLGADNVIGISADQNLDEALLEFGRQDENIYRERFVAAAEFVGTTVRAMFQTLPHHASPLAINLASNAMLRYTTNSEDISLTVTNHPMRSGLNSLLDECTQNPRGESLIPLIFVFIIPLGLSTLAASFVVFPIDERLCKAKQLQLMTGVRTIVFWMSSYAWDVLMMLVLCIAIMIMFPIVQEYDAFTNGGAPYAFFAIIFCYGVASISFAYLFSLFMKTVPGGFAGLLVAHISTGIILGICVHFMEQSNFFEQADSMRSWARIFPTFGASLSLIRFAYKVHRNVRCNMVTPEVLDIICNPNITEFDSVTGSDSVQVTLFRGCCSNCEDFKDNSVQCFSPVEFLNWQGPVESEHVPITEILPGIGQECFYMLLMALVYFLILLIVEYFKAEKDTAFGKKSDAPNDIFPAVTGDEDTLAEKERIDQLYSKGETSKDAIALRNLSKRYGKFAAVSNVSFGVHKGECFGLLGVNGAGKTTLFKMITGNTQPTSGNSSIYPYSLLRNVKKYKTQIGYCPQYDGLIGLLTGRETLEMFCRLRGYPESMVKSETSRLLKTLGLDASADAQCGQYSGGMKRRLSAGISMVGRPKVIMLDEPTSGVDPISRRQFWNLVTSGREAGQSLILTSHSMDECEALCSRLSIMVNGGLKCLGTTQHLKSKYCLGFTIMVKISEKLSSKDRIAKMKPIIDEVYAAYSTCKLKEQHENVAEFQIVDQKVNWEEVFTFLEALKIKYEGILEDYSVNETTLEEIFLNFAKTKYGNRKVSKSNRSKHV